MRVFPSLVSFLIAIVLFAAILRKFIKANALFPLSLKEWRRANVVEGATVSSWNHVPPLWQRVLLVVLMLVIFGVWILAYIQGWFATQKVFLGPTFLLALSIVMIGLQESFPRRYRITDRGLWCKTAGLLGNPERTRHSERRLVLWDDAASTVVHKGKIVIYPRLPERHDFWSLPPWISKGLKRIEIPLSEAVPDLEEQVTAFVNRDSLDKTQ